MASPKCADVCVAVSRVRESKHMRTLLSKEESFAKEWDSLQYTHGLMPASSIKPFFAGFGNASDNKISDTWDPKTALKCHKHPDLLEQHLRKCK